MKTFTNLAHWAFKKCASLGTANRNRYYLFSIIMLLTLGVGNAWAETVYFEGFEENHRTSGNNSYTADAKTYGDWTLTYADAATSGNPLTGTAHVIMRVARNTTNSPSLVSKALLSDKVSISKVSWNCKGNTAQTLKVSYSTDGSNWVEKYSAALGSTANKSFTLDNVPGPIYLKFVVSVASSTDSNRDANIDDITIEGTALSTEETYSVTLNPPSEGGTIEADKAEAKAGDIVKLTATPSTGYKFGAWTVTGASGNVSVKDNQFTMPAEEVTVTASFVEKTKHTISWSVNGVTKTLSPANVYEGDALGTLPTPDPSDICTGKVFVGWTTESNKDYKHATDAPEFITKDTKPSANTTYYAVFATETSTIGNVETTISITNDVLIENLTGKYEDKSFIHDEYTFNLNACVQQSYCQMRDNSTISFIQIPTLPGPITKISCTDCKNASGSTYTGTLHFKSSKTRGNSDTDDIDKITYTSVNSFEWEINNKTHKTGYLLTSAGLRLRDLSITYITEGNTTTYSDYTTSCGATPTIYNVTIAGDIQNGTVTASPTSAAEGVTITLTVTPADGYMLNTLAVTDESSNLISLTDNTFEMPASDVTVSATFKEKPAATLTLSKNGDTSDKIEGKVGDVINLPTFTSDCSKTFVGWDPKSDCAVAPKYAPGAEYTLAAETQTLYAVYANAVEGAPVNVFSETFDACEGTGGNDDKWNDNIATTAFPDDLKNTWNVNNAYAANKCGKFGGGSNKKGVAETPAIALSGSAILTFRAGAWDNDSEVTTLNLSATGANLSQSSITLTKAAWTEYTIYITGATGSVKIKFEASVEDKNRFFLDDVVVSQASVTYSGYSTTCTPALDAPTFTPVAGTYNEVTNVTISATESEVYYTLDGTTPTEESNKYTAPIVLNTNGTTTIKAIAISAESRSSVVTATYTIELPLTTMDEIFAAATTAGGAEAPVLIKMNNWVVSAVKEDGKTAYLTDGTKGLIIYTASHGFNVGDILSGTVACKVQLFKGSAELTELTATTEGLSRTTGGTVSTVVVDDVTTLSGVNTGSVIKINGVHESDNIVNNVKLYNTLFSFENLTPGQEYNVTGVYLQYDATKEILPRSAADIEEVAGLPTATISIENITLVEGDEHTIVATITPDEAASTVTYSIKNGSEYISLEGNVITANAVGTATITAAIAEVDGVYHGTTKDFTVTVNEYVAPISGTWELVTDASTLKAGMEVIVAQYVELDGTIYTMGARNTNNRASVVSSVSGTTLTPTTGTVVLTLVDAGNGTFALQAGNEKYLYAASNTSNHLKETATINDNDDAKWSISVTEGKASVVAQGSNSHNTIRFNKSNNPKIFSCYESGHQQDIALYARVPDHIREVPVGYFATICVPNNIVKVVGATLYKVAGKENGKLYFDEVLVEETEEGMPYVFFTDAATQEFYYGSETTDIAGKENSLQGTFVRLADGDLTGDYMLQSNQIIMCAPTGCWIDPYRAYFDGDDLRSLSKPSAQMPDRRRVSMGAEEENETTGTEDVVAPEGQTLKLIENGQLIIIRNGEKFNAQGVRF